MATQINLRPIVAAGLKTIACGQAPRVDSSRSSHLELGHKRVRRLSLEISPRTAAAAAACHKGAAISLPGREKSQRRPLRLLLCSIASSPLLTSSFLFFLSHVQYFQEARVPRVAIVLYTRVGERERYGHFLDGKHAAGPGTR